MLRNLAPDHTLVLINGKRRHRSSIIDWHGGNGVAFGSQGPDISAIPSIALRQVEVLRDGAAAQYGSDAIAGVMNFQLKDAPSGGRLAFNTGTFGSGDGEAFNVAGNVGLPLGATGFANLSLEYGSSNPTNRSAPRSDAIALRAAGNADIASETPQIWGSPRVDDDLKLFGNFGYTAANGVQFYSHTNYASKKVTGDSSSGQPGTARSKSLTSLCRLQSHPAQYVSGIPSAAILLSISHPIRCSTRCLANVRARISGPMIAL